MALFSFGHVVATPGALEAIDKAAGKDVDLVTIADLLHRHGSGDWGDLDDEDKAANDRALAHPQRILSAYTLATGVKIWIITEWDRSVTTILLPSEY